MPEPATETAVVARRTHDADDAQPEFRYDAVFWLCYAASAALMIGASQLYRYADFVRLLGGDEFQLGLIVGVGMIGSLFVRALQGVGIDRHGVRLMWLGSLALAIPGVLGQLWVERLDGQYVFLLQILIRTGISGAFGASITYVSCRSGERRMAEAVGTLGSSGFLALLVGPMIGDWWAGQPPYPRERLDGLFLIAAGAMSLAVVCAFFATRSTLRRDPEQDAPETPRHSTFALLRRHVDGPLLLMGVMMGVGLTLPGVFVRDFARTRADRNRRVFRRLCVERVRFAHDNAALSRILRRADDDRARHGQHGDRPAAVLAGRERLEFGPAGHLYGERAFVAVPVGHYRRQSTLSRSRGAWERR
ncbi:MAG: hypothetical protein QM811_02115 [Pirellulales bacterium]